MGDGEASLGLVTWLLTPGDSEAFKVDRSCFATLSDVRVLEAAGAPAPTSSQPSFAAGFLERSWVDQVSFSSWVEQ